jgi:hypothetical protein
MSAPMRNCSPDQAYCPDMGPATPIRISAWTAVTDAAVQTTAAANRCLILRTKTSPCGKNTEALFLPPPIEVKE